MAPITLSLAPPALNEARREAFAALAVAQEKIERADALTREWQSNLAAGRLPLV
ncbi:MAG: hypothetical protein AB7Q42_20860 [Acidimicrobiia bacterium]